jgi:predicted dinucleotide-binding enzyme
MAVVSIIGTGNMGSAIADVVRRGGNTVELIGHGDSDKPVTGDVVVLAVYYGAVSDVVAQRGEQLAGKVVVDITNPVNTETFDSLVVPADGSATAEIAAALPQSRVI